MLTYGDLQVMSARLYDMSWQTNADLC
jgi:hypothetical protein